MQKPQFYEGVGQPTDALLGHTHFHLNHRRLRRAGLQSLTLLLALDIAGDEQPVGRRSARGLQQSIDSHSARASSSPFRVTYGKRITP